MIAATTMFTSLAGIDRSASSLPPRKLHAARAHRFPLALLIPYVTQNLHRRQKLLQTLAVQATLHTALAVGVVLIISWG